jgi:O-acetyl-ADP-ribose deacetylase (regulator of RNase III)
MVPGGEMAIKYLKGDATRPESWDNAIIAHIVNDDGKWGKGFVMAISRRWPEPEERYRAWYKDRERPSSGFKLGAVRFVAVKTIDTVLNQDKKVWVANMIAQHGIRGPGNPTPIRYGALSLALAHVAEFAKKNNASVCMPKIGSGLAGGDWEKIERIILETLDAQGVSVTIYEL